MRFFARGARRRVCAGCLGLFVPALRAAQAGAASLDVYLTPSASIVEVADTFEVAITADISEPVLGFGFELSFDSQLFQLDDTTIAPELTPAGKAGGDFISALAFPEPISGRDVLLATATFTALDLGKGAFGIDVAEGDLTQGFAEVAIGAMSDFDVVFGQVTVIPGFDDVGGNGSPPVPEPATLSLLALGGFVMVVRRARS